MKSDNMKLSGVGIRRKNLYVVEVDVYTVGIYLSEAALKTAKRSKSHDAELNALAADLSNHNKAPVKLHHEPQVAAKLSFLRDVGQSSIVEAFNDAFKGCNPEAVAAFKKAYGEAVGPNGLKKGESCTFYWMSGQGGLFVESRGIVTPLAKSQELEQKLLNVYLNPGAAVSPELVSCLKNNIEKLE